jgi:hypothetical protein
MQWNSTIIEGVLLDSPIIDEAIHLPITGIPSFSAFFLVVKITIPAPSPIPLAFPAVVVARPQFSKTGFNPESDSKVTPGRMVSSCVIVFPPSSTGMISSANTPLLSAFGISNT